MYLGDKLLYHMYTTYIISVENNSFIDKEWAKK